VVFYTIPIIVILCLTLFTLSFPTQGGLLIIFAATAFTTWRFLMLSRMHHVMDLSSWIAAVVMLAPGLLFLIDGIIKKRAGYRKPSGFRIREHWKQALVLLTTVCVIVGFGAPLLVRNLGRRPLESFGQVTVEGSGLTLTFAGEGPGWLYSNKHPLVYQGREYTGLAWNEIALFGLEPIGFEGKRYGPNYDGTADSIYYATQDDFDKYNIFRYLNREGTEILQSVQDYWRLPTAEEFVKILTHRGENAGGRFDKKTDRAEYDQPPDKEAPLWAPEMEVIYYWTASSADEREAYDITFSGEVRQITKTTAQDYRGFRAVRTASKAD
jgi:hypothetical protein